MTQTIMIQGTGSNVGVRIGVIVFIDVVVLVTVVVTAGAVGRRVGKVKGAALENPVHGQRVAPVREHRLAIRNAEEGNLGSELPRLELEQRHDEATRGEDSSTRDATPLQAYDEEGLEKLPVRDAFKLVW